jgi:uncharacterized protein
VNAAPPPTADLRLFSSRLGTHLFVADGSRVYDVDAGTAARIERLLSDPGGPNAPALWRSVGLIPEGGRRRIDDTPLEPPPLHAVSLNVAQACNMSCHYCYAETGTFGGRPRLMTREVAEAAVERLIAESEPGARLLLGFMGGEPLLNRDVLHHATRYAARRGAASDRVMRFSITTNATLLTPADAALFAEFPFGVQVSLDGRREENDAARPLNGGGSSYDRAVAALGLIERVGRPRQLTVRVTVTPRTGDLLPILDHLIGLGVDDVGFAAVVVSPSPAHAFAPGDFPRFLERMIACGRATLERLIAGERYPFGNFETALREIHRGSHRPYPCGAGAAYLSANAEGRLFACHRLIDDPAFAMGDVHTGSDLAARRAHLTASRVDRMTPCQTCWARYLCGGGCYHEVSRRGRIGCDYIRGWLEFCLTSYVELSAARPAYFEGALGEAWTSPSNPTTLAH